MAYVSESDMRDWVGGGAALDPTMAGAVAAASAWVDDWCGQTFDLPDAATARTFHACDSRVLHLPPPSRIATTTGLVVETDEGDDGAYESSWTISTDFVLEPAADYVGTVQRPWRTIRAVGSRTFPAGRWGRPTVQVTAKWGWSAVPAPVAQAVKILAAQLWKMKDAPLGAAGFGDLGIIRIRENPIVVSLLAPFVEQARLA